MAKMLQSASGPNFGFNPLRWGSFGWWLQVFLGAVCWGLKGATELLDMTESNEIC